MVSEDRNNTSILGVILAGGRARRMGGQDKVLLKVGSKRILDHIVERLSPQVGQLVLNTNNTSFSDQTDLQIIEDDIFADSGPIGPMGGLFTALLYAKTHGFDKVLTVAGDAPFIPTDFVAKLTVQSENPISIAQSGGRKHPVLGLWDLSVLADLRDRIDRRNYKMMDWVESQSVTFVSWDHDPDPFFNINTDDDLAVAEKILRTE